MSAGIVGVVQMPLLNLPICSASTQSRRSFQSNARSARMAKPALINALGHFPQVGHVRPNRFAHVDDTPGRHVEGSGLAEPVTESNELEACSHRWYQWVGVTAIALGRSPEVWSAIRQVEDGPGEAPIHRPPAE